MKVSSKINTQVECYWFTIVYATWLCLHKESVSTIDVIKHVRSTLSTINKVSLSN